MSLTLVTSFHLFSFLFLFSAISSLAYEARNPEVEALMSIRSAFIDPHGALNNWDQDSVDPCSWPMITCSSDNLVTAFGAPSQGLSGVLSDRIANLTNLRQVLLQNNNITGQIPKGLGNLPKLETLDLANNKLFGYVPVSLFMSNSLQYLRLNNNSLSGAIPLTTATVPQFSFLDLSFNNLSGPVPKAQARIFNLAGNPLICERHPPEGCSGSVTLIPVSSFIELVPGNSKSKSKRLANALGISLSLVTLVLFVAGALSWYRFKKRKQASNINGMQEVLIRLGNLRNFTLKELSYATENFSSMNILGSGGFSNVYEGKLRDGTLVAIKRLKEVTGTTGESQFWAELELISLAIHRNLLRLIGYCATPTERLLVYPYMSNGSVASRLRVKPALNWNARTKIAIGAARGLLYLHEQCDPKIIHRDVKAANVILDDLCEAMVGDFGLAKLLDHADSHVTTAVRGTVGHIAPEYLSTGQSSEKTDVFSFGILLLDLISGMRALELRKTISGKKGVALEEWVKRCHGEEKVQVLVDEELGNNYDKIEVQEMLQIALLCTQYLPCHRPKMSEVVRMLEGNGVAEKWKAPRKRINAKPAFYISNRMPSRVNACPTHVEDSDDENSSSFSMTMDHDHDDAHVMELSGPR